MAHRQAAIEPIGRFELEHVGHDDRGEESYVVQSCGFGEAGSTGGEDVEQRVGRFAGSTDGGGWRFGGGWQYKRGCERRGL